MAIPKNMGWSGPMMQPGAVSGLLSAPPGGVTGTGPIGQMGKTFGGYTGSVAPQGQPALAQQQGGGYQRVSPGRYRAPNGQIVNSQQMPQQKPMQRPMMQKPGMIPNAPVQPGMAHIMQQPGMQPMPYQNTGMNYADYAALNQQNALNGINAAQPSTGTSLMGSPLGGIASGSTVPQQYQVTGPGQSIQNGQYQNTGMPYNAYMAGQAKNAQTGGGY